MNKDYLKIGKYKLNSRLIVGTGKYKSFKGKILKNNDKIEIVHFIGGG